MDVSPTAGEISRPHPLFVRSLNPMLIADDERRYVDANAAACLFLRLPHEAVCKLRIDDLTPPKLRPGMDAMWAQFLQGRFSREDIEAKRWDFHMPDGTSVAAELSSAPHFQPGRHLAIVVFPASKAIEDRLDGAPAPPGTVLTNRERQVLRMVALGQTGVQIASELFLAPDTVKTHVANALFKLRAKNRAHAIAIALQTGELELDDGPDEAPRHPGSA